MVVRIPAVLITKSLYLVLIREFFRIYQFSQIVNVLKITRKVVSLEMHIHEILNLKSYTISFEY